MIKVFVVLVSRENLVLTLSYIKPFSYFLKCSVSYTSFMVSHEHLSGGGGGGGEGALSPQFLGKSGRRWKGEVALVLEMWGATS